jgi:hypothetical protein
VLPSADPYGDAADVDLIVEGRVVGPDRVAVVRTLFAAEPLGDAVSQLTVTGLARHDRTIRFSEGPDAVVETDHVVLLLERDGASAWRPHHLFLHGDTGFRGKEDLTGGAAGTFWLGGGGVWAYAQYMNPGPLVLQRWPIHAKTPGTPETLRGEIEAGLAARRAWESTLAVEDAGERARRLMRWLRPSTSPDGERRTRRFYEVRVEVRKIGRLAVPALVDALDPAVETPAREQALLALGDLGDEAREALPRLLEVAADRGPLSSSRVAYALRGIGDDRAIPALRRILSEADLADMETTRTAASGLVRLRDPEASARIAARLPETLEGLETPAGILTLLEALVDVDAARARTWLAPRASHRLFADARETVERLLRASAR